MQIFSLYCFSVTPVLIALNTHNLSIDLTDTDTEVPFAVSLSLALRAVRNKYSVVVVGVEVDGTAPSTQPLRAVCFGRYALAFVIPFTEGAAWRSFY